MQVSGPGAKRLDIKITPPGSIQAESHAGRFDGPVLPDLAAGSTPGIARLDARHAARVLAGQAITYAVRPEPAEALSEVLRMVGLTADDEPARWPRITRLPR